MVYIKPDSRLNTAGMTMGNVKSFMKNEGKNMKPQKGNHRVRRGNDLNNSLLFLGGLCG